MATVGTTAAATATAYGSQRKIDRCQNGVLWSLLCSGANTGNNGTFYYSMDNGQTWMSAGTLANTGTGAAYTTDASVFIDLDDYAHVVYKDNNNGYLYYTRGTPNAARTAYTWATPTVVWNGSTALDYPDIVVMRNPATAGAWIGCVVGAQTGATSNKTFYWTLSVTAAGAVTVGSATQVGGTLATSNSNASFPSIDFRHNGDGKTAAAVNGSAQPDLFITWSNGTSGAGYGIRFIKGTYANGAWTMGTEREVDNTSYFAANNLIGLGFFDGTRFLISGLVNTSGNPNLILHEVATDGATITTRFLVTAANYAASTSLQFGSASYDTNGNVYLFGEEGASAAGSRTIGYQLWTRSSATLGARQTISTTGNAGPNISARRGYAGQAIDYVYTSGTASPYTVTSGRISLNQPPGAPTVTAPANGATLDTANPLTLTITPQDPDGDNATAWDVRYRATGTTAPFTVVSGPFNPTVANNTSTTIQAIAANTWGGRLDVQVRTYDTSNTAGTWSATVAVTGLPQALASQTGGQGGTAVPAMNLYAVTQAERALRAAGLV